MNTIQEIQSAINSGAEVYWQNYAYKVIQKRDDLYIKGPGGSLTYLGQDFNPKDFFTKNN